MLFLLDVALLGYDWKVVCVGEFLGFVGFGWFNFDFGGLFRTNILLRGFWSLKVILLNSSPFNLTLFQGLLVELIKIKLFSLLLEGFLCN